MLTRNQALEIARERVSMYRQGRGWIVRHYDPRVNMNRVGHETSYWHARSAVTEGRLAEALAALGHGPDDVIYLSSRYGGPDASGTLAERLAQALAV